TYNVLTPCSPCVNEMPICARLKAFGVCLITRQPSDDPSIRVAVVNLQQHVIVVVWDEVGLFERPVPSGCPHSQPRIGRRDRKSTRLNSSHVKSSYAVFCLKKNR